MALRSINQYAKGITLIEVIISVGIFTLLLLAVVMARPSTSSEGTVQAAAYGLVSDLRSLQTKAQAGALFEDQLWEGGYGVVLDRSTLADSRKYVMLADSSDHEFAIPPDKMLPGGEKKFYGNVGVADFWVDGAQSSDQTVLLTFSPNQSVVFVDTEGGSPLRAVDLCVVLQTQTGQTESVRVNGQSGQVEVLSSCP